jgi:hypothetical protein
MYRRFILYTLCNAGTGKSEMLNLSLNVVATLLPDNLMSFGTKLTPWWLDRRHG